MRLFGYLMGCLIMSGGSSAYATGRDHADVAQQTAQASADLLLVHGRVWTEEASAPWAQAIAIKGHRIIAVGTDDEILNSNARARQVIDLRGHLSLPA